jgi:hypothetical protein
VCERAGGRVGVRAEPEEVEQLVRGAPRGAGRGTGAERGDLDVLADGQRAERMAVLARGRDVPSGSRSSG